MKLLTLALVATLAATIPVHARDDDDDTNAIDDTPHITIVGSASTEVVPDLAIVTLGVRSHQPTAAAAANAVAGAARKVVDTAKAQGVKDIDIATQSINLNQTFDDLRDPQGRFIGRKPSGFDASNAIAVRIRDLAKAGALVQQLIDNGANSFDGIAFTVEHPQPVLDKLAAEAVANARRQGEMVARAAGVKLGRVLLIEHPDSGPAKERAFAVTRAATIAPQAMPVEAGTTTLEARMQITWAID